MDDRRQRRQQRRRFQLLGQEEAADERGGRALAAVAAHESPLVHRMLLHEPTERDGGCLRAGAKNVSMRPRQQGEVTRGQRARRRLTVDFQQAASRRHHVEWRPALGSDTHAPRCAELGAEVDRSREPDLLQNIREDVKHRVGERMDMKTGRSDIESAARRNDTAPGKSRTHVESKARSGEVLA